LQKNVLLIKIIAMMKKKTKSRDAAEKNLTFFVKVTFKKNIKNILDKNKIKGNK